MTNQNIDKVIAGVREYARNHYEQDGWDIVVESYSDSELEDFIGTAQTVRGAVVKVKRSLKAHASYRADIEAEADRMKDEDARRDEAPVATPITHVKPTVKLTGTDGNVFALLGLCNRALRRAGMLDEAIKLSRDVFAAGSYDAALALMMEAVNVE